MLHHFLRNAILLIVLNLLVKGVYLLVVERAVQNSLPMGDYGLYFSLLNFSLLLQIVLDFGLQLYNSRNLAGNRSSLAKYFPHFLGLKLWLALGFLAALLLGGWLIGYEREIYPLLGIIGVNQVLMSMMLFMRSNLTGSGRYRADSWISVADKLLMLVFVGGLLLVAGDWLTVYSFALAQTLSWAISLTVVVILLRHRLERIWPKWNPRIAITLLKRAAPFALAVFLMTAYTRADAVMIERLLPDGKISVDHYAAAYRLLDAANMLGFLLSGLLLPMFARLLAKKQEVEGLLKLSLPTVLAGSIVLVVPVAIYAQEIVDLLYDFADARTGSILRLLIFSFVAMCINYVYGALLGAANELKRMNYIFAVGCILNVIGNLLVLPRYGAVGVAAVTSVTQGFIAVAQAWLAHVRLKLPLSILRLPSLFLFLFLFALLMYGLHTLSSPGWIVKSALGVLGGLGLAFLVGLLNIRQWKHLISNKLPAGD